MATERENRELYDRIAALRANPDSKDELPAAGLDEIGDLARDFNGLIREQRKEAAE